MAKDPEFFTKLQAQVIELEAEIVAQTNRGTANNATDKITTGDPNQLNELPKNAPAKNDDSNGDGTDATAKAKAKDDVEEAAKATATTKTEATQNQPDDEEDDTQYAFVEKSNPQTP
jgi:hypothetical protein